MGHKYMLSHVAFHDFFFFTFCYETLGPEAEPQGSTSEAGLINQTSTPGLNEELHDGNQIIALQIRCSEGMWDVGNVRRCFWQSCLKNMLLGMSKSEGWETASNTPDSPPDQESSSLCHRFWAGANFPNTRQMNLLHSPSLSSIFLSFLPFPSLLPICVLPFLMSFFFFLI